MACPLYVANRHSLAAAFYRTPHSSLSPMLSAQICFWIWSKFLFHSDSTTATSLKADDFRRRSCRPGRWNQRGRGGNRSPPPPILAKLQVKPVACQLSGGLHHIITDSSAQVVPYKYDIPWRWWYVSNDQHNLLTTQELTTSLVCLYSIVRNKHSHVY